MGFLVPYKNHHAEMFHIFYGQIRGTAHAYNYHALKRLS